MFCGQDLKPQDNHSHETGVESPSMCGLMSAGSFKDPTGVRSEVSEI
jgi:hypothetical protein